MRELDLLLYFVKQFTNMMIVDLGTMFRPVLLHRMMCQGVSCLGSCWAMHLAHEVLHLVYQLDMYL